MRIVEIYSHLNGQEHILVHKPDLWQEIENVILSVNAIECRTKVSKAARTTGKMLYSPVDMTIPSPIRTVQEQIGWHESVREQPHG